ALLPAEISSPWLYRNILLMMALAAMTLVYGVGMGRVLPSASAWAECTRRLGPILGLLTSLLLFVVLAQEGLLFDKAKKCTEMDGLAIAAVIGALVGMMAAGVYFAVLPG